MWYSPEALWPLRTSCTVWEASSMIPEDQATTWYWAVAE
jgi:hypothetical protein